MCSALKGLRDSHGHKARVLGWEVSHFSPAQQLILIAGGSVLFNLLYGCLQEYLAVHVFERRLGLFMSLLQTFTFALCAYLQRLHLKEVHSRRIPLRWYLLLAFAQSSAMALGNVGMMHLNYAAKVLFKSTKALPMMIWGASFLKRQYRKREYFSVAIMVTGLVVFLEADVLSPAVFSILGVFLMIGCVFMDCCYSNLSELLLRRYDATPEEVIYYTYLGGGMYQASSAIFTGELYEGIRFITEEARWQSLAVIAMYGTAGYFGASCSTALTKNYGALNSALASATRKALNLLLSFALFPKPFTPLHFCGVTLFISGLTMQTFLQKTRKTSKVFSLPMQELQGAKTPLLVGSEDEEDLYVKTAPCSNFNSPGEIIEPAPKKFLERSLVRETSDSLIYKMSSDTSICRTLARCQTADIIDKV